MNLPDEQRFRAWFQGFVRRRMHQEGEFVEISDILDAWRCHVYDLGLTLTQCPPFDLEQVWDCLSDAYLAAQGLGIHEFRALVFLHALDPLLFQDETAT